MNQAIVKKIHFKHKGCCLEIETQTTYLFRDVLTISVLLLIISAKICENRVFQRYYIYDLFTINIM